MAQQGEPAQAWRSRKSLQKRCAAGRACTSVAQQGEPAKVWRSRKSLHSRKSLQKRVAAGRACTNVAQQEEPGQAWRAKIIATEQTEQEEAALTQPSHGNNISGGTSITIIRGLGNNISGETTTNHNHLEKIGTAHETVSQYKAHDVMHLSENADEQKPDNEPTRTSELAAEASEVKNGSVVHIKMRQLEDEEGAGEEGEDKGQKGVAQVRFNCCRGQ